MGTFEQYSDSELLHLLSEGDTTALNEVYRRYRRQLLLFAMRIIQDPNEAEDIVQDVFMIFLGLRSYHEIRNLKSYLYRATRNSVLNRINHNKVREHYANAKAKLPEPSANCIDDELNYQELVKLIEGELLQMPEENRNIFMMSRFDEMSNKEIEQELQLSKDVVKKRISYALKMLRIRLQSLLTFLP